jgi:hypothetical protein
MKITQEELEAIRKRVEAATIGDWDYDVEDFGISNGNFMVAMAELDSEGYPFIRANTADLEFICESREDVPKLLVEIERLRLALAEISDINEYVSGDVAREALKNAEA